MNLHKLNTLSGAGGRRDTVLFISCVHVLHSVVKMNSSVWLVFILLEIKRQTESARECK